MRIDCYIIYFTHFGECEKLHKIDFSGSLYYDNEIVRIPIRKYFAATNALPKGGIVGLVAPVVGDRIVALP